MGGTAGDEPVAITNRRALISNLSPTAIVAASLKRAAPSITCTPRPVKRSFESFGAIAAMTPRTCAFTLAKSISTRGIFKPKGVVRCDAAACLAAASNAFEGTQP